MSEVKEGRIDFDAWRRMDRAPVYIIRQVTEHCWQVLKRTPDAEFGWMYAYLHPASSSCTSEAAAKAWMMADINGGMPDRTAFEPLLDTPETLYDASGNAVAEK